LKKYKIEENEPIIVLDSQKNKNKKGGQNCEWVNYELVFCMDTRVTYQTMIAIPSFDLWLLQSQAPRF